MRKFLLTIVFSAFLLTAATSFQNVSSQTETEAQNSAGEEKKWLRNDLRESDVVAYVDIKEMKIMDNLGQADCENNTGNGYCLYLQTAEIKELFKGKTEKKTLEFYTSADAGYPKKHLFGEKIVFLVRSENENKKSSFSTIENSSRGTEWLEAMRKIVNPQSTIDETDESELYSIKALEKQFGEADAVIFVDAENFKPDPQNEGSEKFIVTAELKENFKGIWKAGQKIEYRDQLLYRSLRSDDLGEQVVFLEKSEENGKVIYSRISYSIFDIEYDILEKLRKIAKEK